MRFLTRLFHLSRCILLSLRSRSGSAAPAPRKALSALARAAGSSGLELVSLAGSHGSAAPEGGNSLLTGISALARSSARRAGAGSGEPGGERTGGGFGVIHEQGDKRCELDKLGMSSSSLPVLCLPCGGRRVFPGVKSFLVLKEG